MIHNKLKQKKLQKIKQKRRNKKKIESLKNLKKKSIERREIKEETKKFKKSNYMSKLDADMYTQLVLKNEIIDVHIIEEIDKKRKKNNKRGEDE